MTEWADAFNSSQRVSDTRVELIDTYGQWVADVPADAVSVSMDSEATERWGCQLRVVNQMIPLLPSDPLDPRANLRIRVWWRELLASGWDEMLVCTLYPADPEVEDSGIPTVTVTGRDALSEARRGGYKGQTINVGGKSVTYALEKLFQVVAPGIPVSVADSDEALPSKYTLGEQSPDDDWTQIAAMADFTVYTDRSGVIQVGPEPEPDDPSAVWSDSESCKITQATRSMNTTDMRNRIVVRSTHPKIKKPVVGVAEDTDEGSPTWVGLGRIWEESIDSDKPTTVTAARKLARQELIKRLMPMDEAKVTIPARPDLDGGDLCLISRARTGLAGEYRVASWSIVMPQKGAAPEPMTVAMKAKPRVDEVSDDE